jgi:PAS domain-containing protein
MLGGQAREMAAKPAEPLAIVHRDDVAGARPSISNALNGVTPEYREEHRVRRLDGEWIWILSRGEIIERDRFGQPLRVIEISALCATTHGERWA